MSFQQKQKSNNGYVAECKVLYHNEISQGLFVVFVDVALSLGCAAFMVADLTVQLHSTSEIKFVKTYELI